MSDEVVIRISPCTYSEDIYILIPPKFYQTANLAEGIKHAINEAQKNGGSTTVVDTTAFEHPIRQY